MNTEFPPGWDEDRVRDVLAYYQSQTDDEVAAEYETAPTDARYTTMQVPTELVPVVRALIGQQPARAEG